MLMVDRVVSIEEGRSIRAIKNVTASESYFPGHSRGRAALPGTLIVEAIGQSASILFTRTTGTGVRPGEFLILGAINEMRFLRPVIPGDKMEINVTVSKLVGGFAVVEAAVTVEGTEVARGTLGFARRTL